VVDVRDDREIADVLGIHENAVNTDSSRCGRDYSAGRTVSPDLQKSRNIKNSTLR
jgi:hypothetical protein